MYSGYTATRAGRRIAIFFGIVVTESVRFAAADEAGFALSRNLEALVKSNYEHVDSVEYNATVHVQTELDKTQFLSTGLTPEKKQTIKYLAAGDRYFYEIDTQWWNSDPKEAISGAYNGDLYQRLTEQPGYDARLILSKNATQDKALAGINVLFLPFQFLVGNGADKETPTLHLSAFKAEVSRLFSPKNALWSGSAANVSGDVQELVLSGGSCLPVHSKLIFRVSLDQTSKYPMGWKLFNHDGLLVREYIVDELAELQGFKYPKRARMVEYGMHLVRPDTRPRATLILKVESLKVNLESADFEDAFTIDPTKATLIYDSDTRTAIPVPR